MLKKYLPLLVCVLAAGLWPVTGSAQQPPGPTTALGDGLLLLRNGQSIAGKIAREGDRYRVIQPDAELRLKAADVEFFCHNFEEGYQRKRALIQPGDAYGHLQLAQWCQRNELLGRAAEELAAATAIEPTHPMLAPLQRRLTMALEKPEAPSPRRVADTQGPSADDLDRMTRGMPPGTVEAFAQFVQPILMNHCAGCHGSQSDTKLQLIRVYAGQPTLRRTTQRNLHAVLPWVDRDNPEASRLLTTASGPHGTAKAPVFTDRQMVQYRRLVDWVYHVAQCPSPVAVEMLVGPDPWTEPAPPPLPRPRAIHARPVPRSAREAPTGQVGASAASGRTTRSRTAGPDSKPAAAPSERAATDPFDPEAFNRQLAPAGAPSAPAAMPTPAAAALGTK
jgi:hypothetical protein